MTKKLTFSLNANRDWTCEDCNQSFTRKESIYRHIAHKHPRHIEWINNNSTKLFGNDAKNGKCVICNKKNFRDRDDIYKHYGNVHIFVDLYYRVNIKDINGSVRNFHKSKKFWKVNNAGDIIKSNKDIICNTHGKVFYPEKEVRNLSNATNSQKCCDGGFKYPNLTLSGPDRFIVALYEDKGKNHVRTAINQITETINRLKSNGYKISFVVIYISKFGKQEKKMWSVNENTYELATLQKNKQPFKIGTTRVYIFQSRYSLRKFWFNLSNSNLDIYQQFNPFIYYGLGVN